MKWTSTKSKCDSRKTINERRIFSRISSGRIIRIFRWSFVTTILVPDLNGLVGIDLTHPGRRMLSMTLTGLCSAFLRFQVTQVGSLDVTSQQTPGPGQDTKNKVVLSYWICSPALLDDFFHYKRSIQDKILLLYAIMLTEVMIHVHAMSRIVGLNATLSHFEIESIDTGEPYVKKIQLP